ncbi:MAG: ferrous iron transport protein A [Alphaproteobacteria bacterium]|nr:ferrous iron transport protein A [Alphaproteobacteria bacterium]
MQHIDRKRRAVEIVERGRRLVEIRVRQPHQRKDDQPDAKVSIQRHCAGDQIDSVRPAQCVDEHEISGRQDQRGEIISLDDAVQGFTRRRFLDLGLTPGTMIYPELGNFFGDPRAYRVRGTLIALRKDQAAQIWVKPI